MVNQLLLNQLLLKQNKDPKSALLNLAQLLPAIKRKKRTNWFAFLIASKVAKKLLARCR
jgi:hypothetical protein